MHAAEFQKKWIGVTLKERSAAQEHFIDLCHVLGVPTPADANPDGIFYTLEWGGQEKHGRRWVAYGWDDPDPAIVDEDTILSSLLALNAERATVAAGVEQ